MWPIVIWGSGADIIGHSSLVLLPSKEEEEKIKDCYMIKRSGRKKDCGKNWAPRI
jgi:hypothetical protein